MERFWTILSKLLPNRSSQTSPYIGLRPSSSASTLSLSSTHKEQPDYEDDSPPGSPIASLKEWPLAKDETPASSPTSTATFDWSNDHNAHPASPTAPSKWKFWPFGNKSPPSRSFVQPTSTKMQPFDEKTLPAISKKDQTSVTTAAPLKSPRNWWNILPDHAPDTSKKSHSAPPPGLARSNTAGAPTGPQKGGWTHLLRED